MLPSCMSKFWKVLAFFILVKLHLIQFFPWWVADSCADIFICLSVYVEDFVYVADGTIVET